MLTTADKILILSIIVFSIFLTIYFGQELSGYNSKLLIIKIDGEDYKRIKLDENIKNKEIPVQSEYGYNLIEIDEGKVRVKEASCKDKLDVLQGQISEIGDIIVCLPNRLTIEIDGIKKDNKIDRLSR